jgi:hypothetical protein
MKKKKKVESKKLTKIHITGTQIIPPAENLPTNPNIPTHHADMVSFLFGNDGSTLVGFFARTQGINVEECRVSFSKILAEKIVDILSSNLNYYPQKALPEANDEKNK